ncbi:urea transporter [Streptomyces sp. NBC_01381]|uniref:urea transporter n=1 Tax=Streptomyces sp. NBC_01381 TaxID=2903845 RepID=UPI002254C857|nr:urea transporter [Streptomyces sp. NBC_01381]MCX4672058.1 urea transporter [Streptomyces sp. NBC_01381]
MITPDTWQSAAPETAAAAADTARPTAFPGPVRLTAQLVRSFGQLGLQTNVWAGGVFLLAFFVGSWRMGVFGLLGAVVSTATAYALGVDRGRIDLGLEGFSGCLTGLALFVFLGPRLSTYLLTVVGAVVCVLICAALTALLAPWRLPALTAPFCVVGGALLTAAPAFTRVWHGGSPAFVPVRATGGTRYTWTDLWHGFFANIAEVGLSAHWYVGAIMLVGLFVAGIRPGLAAVVGSALAVLLAWGLGAPPGAVAAGVYGYNAVLVAIALGTLFLAGTVSTALYTLVGVAVATVLTAALNAYFAPFGGRTLSWPFIITTWLFLAAATSFPRIRRTA